MKFIEQHDQNDCGPACLAMIASHYGKNYSLQYMRENSFISREGVSLLGISEAANSIGFETFPTKLSIENIIENKSSLPCILHWNQNHFVVLRKISHQTFTKKQYFHILDPAHGIIKLNEEKFKQAWLSNQIEGVSLFLYPKDKFFLQSPQKEEKLSLSFLFNYLVTFKKQLSGIFFMLLIGCCLSLIFPFFTQNLIDKGVVAKDLNIITIILLAQLAVYFGSITIEIIRNWLMLNVGTKISISIISDFLGKVLQLPINFFESKMMGDFHQRIQDNERIEIFLTSQSLVTFFSMITFLVFFGVLWYYDFIILLVYFSLTVVSLLWSFYWLQKRKILDYYRFQLKGQNQDNIYEILSGVTEMKLNQFENYKLNEWKSTQKKLLKINIRILKVDQLQLSGFEFLNQIKNIIVTFLAATLVVKDVMSLGVLLAISYIIGQLNSPINQLVAFFRSLQDAKLSLERLNEVQNQMEEEQEGLKELESPKNFFNKNDIPKGVLLKNVSFQYEGPHSPYVLKNISMFIPQGKIIAIVGASGSGKTTLIKLLLKFYNTTNGTIYYNDNDILTLSPRSIRENCGVVMQDGFIFSDTIKRNIATKDESIDMKNLNHAIKMANLSSFVENLPMGYNTKIGIAGNGISGGEKQRILIARAIYKAPHYIFLDEATSSLDAENEKIIHDNLQSFFRGRTVVIVAHRLSTVKKAFKIIVLKHGEIVEQGNHNELVAMKGEYYNLISNQLELGT